MFGFTIICTYIHKIHIYICTYIHIYIYIYIHIYIYTYVYIYTYIHIYIYTCIHTYIPTYIPTYLPTYIHTYAGTFLTTAHFWRSVVCSNVFSSSPLAGFHHPAWPLKRFKDGLGRANFRSKRARHRWNVAFRCSGGRLFQGDDLVGVAHGTCCFIFF